MNYADLFRITLSETALEVAALVVLVVDLGFLRKAQVKTRIFVASLLGVLGCGAALLVLPMQPMGGLAGPGGDLLLSAGGYSAIAQVGILALTVMTLFLFIDSEFTRHAGEYVAVVLMAAAGGLLISSAQDLLVIFVGLELLSLGLYILAAFAKKSGKSAEGALKYYLYGGMSAAFLLFGFSYLYGLAGSTNLHRIMLATYGTNAPGTSPLLYVALVMIAAGLGFKVAAVPFHMWAPDAYEGSPAPSAAFIASVSKVASFALLIGIGTAAAHVLDHAQQVMEFTSSGPLPKYLGFRSTWSLIVVLLAVASMVLGNLAALAQVSVRRLLAYSAIAHAGYMLLALAYFSHSAMSANAIQYYILTYGITIIGAFGAVGIVERVAGSDRLDAFLGLSQRNPVLASELLVLFLSLAGIPPLVGFWAKFNLFVAVLKTDRGVVPLALVALAVAMSAVSLYYYLQVLKRVYVMPAADKTPIRASHITMITLQLITAAVVVLGCFPELLQRWIAGF